MNNKQRTKLVGALLAMKTLNIKPNYSELQRQTGINRKTISKYDDVDGIPERKKREQKSKYDKYLQFAIETFNINSAVTIRAVYEAIIYYYPDFEGTYNGFKSYLRRKGIGPLPKSTQAHVFYETEPGEQLQFDWKEDLAVHLIDGTEIKFNVFSATLGYSRLHIFIYSKHRTEQDAIRCIIEVVKRLGGRCQIFKTDNMSAIISITKDGKHVHPTVKQFFEDLGSKLELCKPRACETKGKVETSNKFPKWILAHDYRLKSEEELISVIEKQITDRSNMKKHSTTMIAPILLFNSKEKEHLLPVGNKILMENYISNHSRGKVQETLLVNYDGKGYSVPKKYLGYWVDLYVIGSELYIYHNKKLVTIHTLSQNKKNYKPEHYKEGLASALHRNTREEDIEELAMKNLNRLNRFGGN